MNTIVATTMIVTGMILMTVLTIIVIAIIVSFWPYCQIHGRIPQQSV